MEPYRSELDQNSALRREVTLEIERHKKQVEVIEAKNQLAAHTKRLFAAIGLLLLLLVIPQTRGLFGLIIYILLIPAILKDTRFRVYSQLWRNLKRSEKELEEWDGLIKEYRREGMFQPHDANPND